MWLLGPDCPASRDHPWEILEAHTGGACLVSHADQGQAALARYGAVAVWRLPRAIHAAAGVILGTSDRLAGARVSPALWASVVGAGPSLTDGRPD
jgi:hypothetical protein